MPELDDLEVPRQSSRAELIVNIILVAIVTVLCLGLCIWALVMGS